MRLLTLILLIIVIISIVIFLTTTNENFYFKKRRRRRRRRRRRSLPKADYAPPLDSPPENITYTPEQQAIANIIGPSYSYAKHIKNPKKLGVKTSSKPDDIIKDVNALAKYVGYLVTGPALGNAFYIKSGTCDKETSTPECKGKDRWIYVNNIPGNNPCLKDMGIDIPGGKMSGIIPGIIEDIIDISTAPIEILDTVFGDNTDSFKCSLRGRKTGPSNNLRTEVKCSPPDKAVSCMPEFFQSKNDNSIEDESPKNNYLFNLFIIIVIIFLIIGIVLIWRNTKRTM